MQCGTCMNKCRDVMKNRWVCSCESFKIVIGMRANRSYYKIAKVSKRPVFLEADEEGNPLKCDKCYAREQRLAV